MAYKITQPQTLTAMAKKGLIKFPIDRKSNGQVFTYADHNENGDWSFTYQGAQYRLRYDSGCFYPYVYFEKLIKDA